MKIKEIADLFLGNTPKKKFKKIMTLLIWFSITAILFYNISYTKLNGFEWKPAGTVNIELKKGSE